MKYKAGDYILNTGWGGKGIYLTSSIVGTHEDGRDIITEDGIVAGSGGGWYSDSIFNADICQEIVRIANQYTVSDTEPTDHITMTLADYDDLLESQYHLGFDAGIKTEKMIHG